jgi:hypothetical protein
MLWSTAIVGAICYSIALWAAWGLEETYAKELDYVELI